MRHGLLQVWNATTYEKATFGGEWRIDCNRLYSLVLVGAFVVGSGDNGTVYVWDEESHWFLRQFAGKTFLSDAGIASVIRSNSVSSTQTSSIRLRPFRSF